MIPVLVVPVLNRYDLLWRMLSSVDADVGTLFVVDNGGGLERDDVLDAVDGMASAVRLVDCGANLGVAASWNLGIKANVAAPWWAFAGVDTDFGHGDLARLARHMEAADGPTCGMLLEFGAFAVNAAAVETVGWFDEAYHPIYAEDTDWRHRARLLGVPVVAVPSSTRHVEGGSVTIRERGTNNGRTYPANVAYCQAKWGGLPHAERWELAFGSLPPNVTMAPPLSRLRELAW